jgi:hypothetical protein
MYQKDFAHRVPGNSGVRSKVVRLAGESVAQEKAVKPEEVANEEQFAAMNQKSQNPQVKKPSPGAPNPLGRCARAARLRLIHPDNLEYKELIKAA